MSKPLVSVCIVTYNHARYIRQCLESIVGQETDFEFEILIHDDASTDETQTIIKEFEIQFPDIVKPIYQTENQFRKYSGKIHAAFNYNRARGKYIALCDGDDYWLGKSKLQKQVNILENQTNVAGVFHNTYTQLDTQPLQESVNALFRKEFKSSLSLADLAGSPFTRFHTSSLLFRKQIADNLPEFDWLTKSGDLLLFYEIANAGLIARIKGVHSVYRLNKGGVTNRALHQNAKEYMLLMFDKMNEYYNFRYQDNFEQSKQIISGNKPKKSSIINKLKWRINLIKHNLEQASID